MEYLDEEDQKLAKKGLEDIRSKLCSPQQDVLERLKSKQEEFRFGDWFQRAEEYSNTNLPTARLIWEYLLEKCNDKKQTIDVLNKLFHVQIAAGPWDEALKTAQKVFKETKEIVSPETSAERSLGNVNHVMVFLILWTNQINQFRYARLWLPWLDKPVEPGWVFQITCAPLVVQCAWGPVVPSCLCHTTLRYHATWSHGCVTERAGPEVGLVVREVRWSSWLKGLLDLLDHRPV